MSVSVVAARQVARARIIIPLRIVPPAAIEAATQGATPLAGYPAARAPSKLYAVMGAVVASTMSEVSLGHTRRLLVVAVIIIANTSKSPLL
jgi:hypothetical protein